MSSNREPVDLLEVKIRKEVKARPNWHLRDCAEQQLSDFSTNDFLSMATHEEMTKRFLQRLTSMKGSVMGPAGSRLLVPAPHHIALEARIAKMWTANIGADTSRLDALFFPTGYTANLAFWSSLPQEGDVVIFDELIHASAHDGLRLGRVGRGQAFFKTFRHNDLNDLYRLLQEDADAIHSGKMRNHNVFIAIETIYSMDGDVGSVSATLAVARQFGNRVKVVVDEAHALGVFNLGLSMPPYVTPEESNEVFARTLTFGKGPGVAGAAMVVKDYVKPYLVATARCFIFSTAPTVFAVLAVDGALEALEDGTAAARAATLQDNIRTLLRLLHKQLAGIPEGLVHVPIPVPGPNDTMERSPVIPVVASLGGEAHVVALSKHLRLKYGIMANPVAYPVVARDSARVRVCLTAGHSRDQMEALARGVGEWARMQLVRNTILEGGSEPPRETAKL
ncbi:PLP-dependent transferase [Auriculariales sp. MPI-PUGE-AT-0066]|nr:PLP-dependent transferase [Auriculariales sp. MPI-PUGE-AT-0066]